MKPIKATLGIGAILLAGITTAQSDPNELMNLEDLRAVTPTKFYAPDHVVVSFKKGISPKAQQQIARSYGLTISRTITSRYFTVLDLSAEQRAIGITVEQVLDVLSRDSRFNYVEFDNAIWPEEIPNDTNFAQQYALNNTGQTGGLPDADVDAVEGWDLIPSTGPEIIIADADDGFNVAHPDIANNIWVNADEIAGNGIDDDGNGFVDDFKGWDFVDNNNDVSSAGTTSTHGMHTIGIIGMVSNNSQGGSGIVRRAKLMPIRIYNGQSTWMTALANAVDYAWQNGASVISVSYNIDGYTTTLLGAIGRAKTADMVYCNSAGNNSQNIDTRRGAIRAIHDNATFVVSTDHNNAKSSFSNFGQSCDFATPGSEIYSTLLPTTYGLNSGTSMACPLGAGIIAMVRLMQPELTAPQAIARVRLSSDMVPALAGLLLGGRANLARAINLDSVRPSDPTDLKICNRATTAVKLSFGASGDDGLIGEAGSYQLRISTAPITSTNFSSATLVKTINGGVPAGTLISETVNGLVPGQTVYFAVKAFDDNVNSSTGIAASTPVNLMPAVWMDDVEGASQFTATGTWAVAPGNGSNVWMDSPAGNYANGSNSSITSNSPVTLGDSALVQFTAQMDLEANADFLYAEVSTNGVTWVKVYQFTGATSGFAKQSFSLDRWANQTVFLRFRLQSDGTINRAGVSLDNIAVIDAVKVSADNVESTPTFNVTSPWAVTSTRFFSSNKSITESLVGAYTNNMNTVLAGSSSLDLSNLPNATFGVNTYLRAQKGDGITLSYSENNGATWLSGSSLISGVESTWSSYSGALPSTQNVMLGVRFSSNGSVTDDGVNLDDFVVVGEQYINVIPVDASIGGFLGDYADRHLTLKLLAPGTDTVLATFTLDGGAQVINTAAGGEFDILIDGDQTLARRFSGVTVDYCTPVMTAALINGDADNDNEIGPGDFALLASFFASDNSVCDFDGDGEVGPGDFAILTSNFGQTGE